MAAEDDQAWDEWSAAHQKLGKTRAALRELRNLPLENPKRMKAAAAVKLAEAELASAAAKID